MLCHQTAFHGGIALDATHSSFIFDLETWRKQLPPWGDLTNKDIPRRELQKRGGDFVFPHKSTPSPEKPCFKPKPEMAGGRGIGTPGGNQTHSNTGKLLYSGEQCRIFFPQCLAPPLVLVHVSCLPRAGVMMAYMHGCMRDTVSSIVILTERLNIFSAFVCRFSVKFARQARMHAPTEQAHKPFSSTCQQPSSLPRPVLVLILPL